MAHQNSFFGLEDFEIGTISGQVAPFLGNTIFRRTDSWCGYRYYSMYSTFEKVAQAYGETQKYETFKRLHDEYIADVQATLPRADGRRTRCCASPRATSRRRSPLTADGQGDEQEAGPRPRDVVTEELLADVFGVHATVHEGIQGPEIIPHRPAPEK